MEFSAFTLQYSKYFVAVTIQLVHSVVYACYAYKYQNENNSRKMELLKSFLC